jgi:hypothetical protein
MKIMMILVLIIIICFGCSYSQNMMNKDGQVTDVALMDGDKYF